MKISLKITTLVFLLVINTILRAQNTQESITNFKQQTDAIVTLNNNFNTAAFVRFPANKHLSLQGNSLQEKATHFLNQYKSIYKLTSISNSLQFDKIKTDNYGLKNLILKQKYNGVPVFDTQLRFHFDRNDKLTAVNGNFIPSIKINTTPTLNTNEANSIALRTIKNQHINNSGEPLQTFSTTLYIFQKGLAQGYNGGNYLVYEVEIRNDTDVREFLYIDAHTGAVVEQFTGMEHALNRTLYEGNTATIVWQEGNPFPGALDQWQQNEVVVSSHVYNFYKNAFGRISYNNADAPMKTINNDPGINCPNANWNGTTANYCTGTASDDVVAHEWGHAYTEYTSNLIYQYQSGAMNESFSDIWGETIDLINNYEDTGESLALRTGCGSSDRWRIGEKATAFGGAIRDMWNPTCNGDPGKVTDTQYKCGAADAGGVHSNSGVPNHTYALIVDGGFYNGQAIAGIGMIKAVHIFWRAQSTYLTRTSDFANLADALEASCTDLIGINLQGLSTTSTPAGLSGQIITAADCAEVSKAILATELRTNPAACNFQPLLAASTPLCGASTSNPLFYEDWEAGIGSWTVSQLPVNASTWQPRDWTISNSLPNGRVGKGIFGTDPVIGDCSADLENGILRLESPVITIPNITTGTFEMSFNHYVATESGWDGGNLKYSVNGSPWAIIPSASFTTNPYNSTLKTTAAGNDNPLAGESAFTGTDGGSNSGSWGQSTIDLSSLGVTANSTIKFRWEMSTDGCNGIIGWYLDEIVVYNCSAVLSIDKYTQMIDGVTIYPNPSNGIVTLQKTAQVDLKKLEIFDVNGRLLKTVDVSNMQLAKSIDINNLASGIYFITVTSNDAKGVMRLIKQ